MRKILFPMALVAIVFCRTQAYAQDEINRLIDSVHSRVEDAAKAAHYVAVADAHRKEAQRLAAAGQREEARTELVRATEVITSADPTIRDDLFLQDYISVLRQAAGALNTVEEQPTQNGILNQSAIRLDTSFIRTVLEAHSLPPALDAIVTIESGGDPMALSSKGARGLWQLMPETARRYGLRVDDAVDERTDPIKSTYAAVRYLRDLYETFHDWPLALAAYNTGENRIRALIEKTDARGFPGLARKRLLPRETIEYVPAVLNRMEKASSMATSQPE